ncbi:unnamed protein product [Orchesella dallaii]|uniref:Major facilitator superfamily (MFS) profile domain-containing protein n=2 Tax=Orchesella dallaii TaxID=48710 RepID=A0ABP1RQU7_9HEXA
MSSFWKCRNQILAAVAATIGGFGLGTALGYTSPAMPDLRERIARVETDMTPLSEEEESWIGGILNLGGLASAIYVGLVLDVIGRKLTMLILAPPFVAGWLLIGFATNSAMLITGRALLGFCGGSFSIAAPLYVTEIAEDRIRGALGSLLQVMVVLGILFSYVVGAFISYKWLAVLCSFVPVIFFFSMIFIPETPRYLLTKGRASEASDSLTWLRQNLSAHEIEVELKQIEASVNDVLAEKSSFRDLFEYRHLYPTSLMIGIMLFQQLSGVNAVIFYTTDIFHSAGASLPDYLSTIIFGVVQLSATVLSTLLVDKAGRKILFLTSSAVMCVSLIALGIYFQLKSEGKNEGLGWLPLVSLMLFICAFSIGYGPLPWLLLGEMIPQKVKARAASIVTMVNWILCFVVTKFFRSIQEALTIQWCYWIFSVCCAVGFVFVLILLPETKGKTFAEIDEYFGRRAGSKGSVFDEGMEMETKKKGESGGSEGLPNCQQCFRDFELPKSEIPGFR